MMCPLLNQMVLFANDDSTMANTRPDGKSSITLLILSMLQRIIIVMARHRSRSHVIIEKYFNKIFGRQYS